MGPTVSNRHLLNMGGNHRIVRDPNPFLITNGQGRFQELKALISQNGRIPQFALLARIGSNSLTQCLFFHVDLFAQCMTGY